MTQARLGLYWIMIRKMRCFGQKRRLTFQERYKHWYDRNGRKQPTPKTKGRNNQ